MFTKHVSELEYSDIEDLVNVRQEKEGYRLDYKLELNNNPDAAKKDLAKDVSSFANSYGGFLIIGVDDNGKIVGIENKIQNKKIDEWINQVLNSNIEPQLFYFDPAVIFIPDSDKVIVVIHIPESTKKPHFANDWHNYFIRVNDRSKKANHNEIRDMFEFSRNRTDEFNSFLNKRNLFDEDSSNFGLNKNSKNLVSKIPEETGLPKPIILFSLIPKYPNEEKINLSVDELKRWLNKNSQGYYPLVTKWLYEVNEALEVKLDGIVLKHEHYNRGLQSYFEILNNGYIEAGFSNTLTFAYPKKILYGEKSEEKNVAIYLTEIVGYEMLLLGFAQKFYELANYYDEVLLQVSFVNVLNLILHSFNALYGDNLYRHNEFSNNQHEDFKLNFRFNPNTLTEEKILSIAKEHSEKICRAFGHEKDYCFIENKLSLDRLHRLRYR